MVSYRLEHYSRTGNLYRFDIHDSELLADDIKELKCSGVLLSYDTDEPFAPVKGSSLEVKYINEINETPLSVFYTENDNRFKGILYRNGSAIWQGFLVQDDSNETLTVHNKEVTLSFNDNIGLLKNVSWQTAVSPNDPFEYYNYLDIVLACLRQTGLTLDLHVFSSLALDGSSSLVISEWGVMGHSFLDKNCFEVLEETMRAIRATLLQSNNTFKIIRWAEGIYSANDIDGSSYDIDGVSLGAVSLNDVVEDLAIEVTTISQIQRPLKSVTRGYDFKRPTELIRNENLNNKGDFIPPIQIGTFWGQYSQLNTYELPNDNSVINNYVGLGFDGVDAKIVIQYDGDTLKELSRYYQITTVTPSNPPTAIGYPNLQLAEVFVNEGDRWNFSLDLNYFNIAIPLVLPFMMCYVQTAANNYIPLVTPGGASDTYLEWGTPITTPDQGQTFQQSNYGSLFVRFKTLTVGGFANFDFQALCEANNRELPRIPATGKLVFRFYPEVTTNGAVFAKNIRLTVNSTVVNIDAKGQENSQTQTPDIKNVTNNKQLIDDSPSLTNAGALIANTAAFVKPLTALWKRNYAYTTEKRRLSEITTFEDLFNRRKPRTKIDGLLVLGDNDVSIDTVLRWAIMPNKNFIFGRATFDLANETVEGTLYENYEDGEEDADLTNTYNFRYIYEQ